VIDDECDEHRRSISFHDSPRKKLPPTNVRVMEAVKKLLCRQTDTRQTVRLSICTTVLEVLPSSGKNTRDNDNRAQQHFSG
jgi:hypothetical protein